MKNFFRKLFGCFCFMAAMLLLMPFINTNTENSSQKADRESLASSLSDSLFPSALAGFGTTSASPWANYTSWPSSSNLDPDDTMMQTLYVMQLTAPNKQTITDFNGDGLTDVIYHSYSGSYTSSFVVLLNTGNMGFDMVYKCVREASPVKYYGDCADV